MSTQTASRRDRQRSATEAEIKAAARGQLADVGVDGVSLRGIAREMGMTAPAIYRYFDSLEGLMASMCADFFEEVADAIDAALAEAGPDLTVRLHAAVRTFRRWAVDHPAEFTMMFRKVTNPTNQLHHVEASQRFAGLFFELFVTMWHERPFEPPPAKDLPRAACDQLAAFADEHGVQVDEGALWVFARAWVRLYGVICMEVFGQLAFMFPDVQPYFEAELAALTRTIGIDYLPVQP